MKIIKKLDGFKILAIFTVGLLFSSCDEFVDIDLPNTQLTSDAVFDDITTAEAALTSIYSKIRDRGILSGTSEGLSLYLGNYADELDYYGYPTSVVNDFYSNSLSASNSGVEDIWTITYSNIYASNAIIYGVENSENLSLNDRNQVKGEALFIRALLHFYLANLYGDLPYITTTDYIQNSTVSRLPLINVYSAIKADLILSSELLPEDYLNTNRVRPNKFTALALLARLYLYEGSWQEASDISTSIINATNLYEWQTNIDIVFKKDSPSTIWQLSPSYSGFNTEEGGTFLFTSGPPPKSALTSNILNAFSEGDLRRTHWVGEVTDGTQYWYHPNKYKNRLTENLDMQEYSIMFRLAEQYLIRAEARAHQGDISGAKQDLDKVRNRAGLANTTAITPSEIIEAVLKERRFELFTEMGHRFFDLKRTDNLNPVLSQLKPGWDNNDKLLPLPSSELLLNPNLMPQNPGY